jgi:hypothetical protein
MDLMFRTFHAFSDPPAAFWLREMIEFNADSAAIIAAGFLGEFTGDPFEIGKLERREETEGIKSGFIETPAAENGEDTLAFGVRRAVVRGDRFSRGFRGFVGD